MAKEIARELAVTAFTVAERATYAYPGKRFLTVVNDTLSEARKFGYPNYNPDGEAHVIGVNHTGKVLFLTSCKTEEAAKERARQIQDETLLHASVQEMTAARTIFLPVTSTGALIWEKGD